MSQNKECTYVEKSNQPCENCIRLGDFEQTCKHLREDLIHHE